MNKILAIVRREFIERVRQRWFWVMALLAPVLFGALIILPGKLITQASLKHIAVVDGTSTNFGALVVTQFDTAQIRAVLVRIGPNVPDSLRHQVTLKRLDGFLLLTDSVTGDSGRAEYRASNVSSITTTQAIENTLQRLASQVRLQREGVDLNAISRARVRIHLTTSKIAGDKVTGESAAQSFSLAYFMGIILYMAILLYGINVMSSVLEEKTNRIVEVLVSSVTPFQLMAGKVIGVGAVSLFQFVIWGVLGRAIFGSRALGANSPGADAGFFTVPHITVDTAIVFFLYFIGGFMLYSAMFAAVGAMSSNEQEARQAQQPVSMLLVLSFISMFGMLNDPSSTFSVTLSMIPFTAPIAMPVRWAAGNLPVSEVAISVAILAASIVGVTWVAARIYRVGILMTGKRPNPKELLRWIRTA